MKSIVIMTLGLGICFLGLYFVFQGQVRGLSGAKWYWISGGAIFFIGALVNHWEHTRRD